MFGVTTSDDYQPVTWVGRHPVHVTTLLVAVHVFAAIAGLLPVAFGGAAFSDILAFRQRARLAARRVLADRDLRFCPFRLRRFFGSRSRCTCSSFSDAKWNASSAAAPSSFSTLCSSRGADGASLTLGAFGSASASPAPPALHFGIFIAFATIYPSVEMLLRIQAKWVALVLAAISHPCSCWRITIGRP